MKRTERLLAMTEILRARRTGVTAEQLADRFGVSIRTIYRDVDTLRGADLPLLADPGPGGGYALHSSYQLPPINFTAREGALLITACVWLERFRLIPFVDTLAEAADKVRAAMPEMSRRRLHTIIDSLSFVGVPSRPIVPEVRKVVEQAWFESRPLVILYDGHRGRTERRIELRGLVLDRSEVLLNCTDLELDEPRQFRLHRIAAARLIDQAAG